MPLTKGYSKSAIGKNIATEEAAGKPREQAVAIGLNTAREAADKDKMPSKGPKPEHDERGRDVPRVLSITEKMLGALGLPHEQGPHVLMLKALEEGNDRLTYKGRERMKKSEFAVPAEKTKNNPSGKGAYPIEDAAHARDALARVAADGTPEEKAEVRRKVDERYPGIDSGEKGKK